MVEIVKMVSGVSAVAGMRRLVFAAMVCTIAQGLLAGWVQPLFTEVTWATWLGRTAVLWAVAVCSIWAAVPDLDKPVLFCFLMFIFTAMLSAWLALVIDLITRIV